MTDSQVRGSICSFQKSSLGQAPAICLMVQTSYIGKECSSECKPLPSGLGCPYPQKMGLALVVSRVF